MLSPQEKRIKPVQYSKMNQKHIEASESICESKNTQAASKIK